MEAQAMSPMSPGRRVRLERVRLGWTQAQLAERAGLLRRTVTEFELGRRKPADTTVHKLSAALDIDPEELLP
jgi:transcriptional regulator with XRE-family HTH domain